MPETQPTEVKEPVLTDTAQWFATAIPEPTSKNFSTQLGCHFEEVREMVHELNPLNPITADLLSRVDYALHALAKHLKENELVVAIRDRVEYVDALADQIVTAVGCGHMAKLNVVGALGAVNTSNFSKFENGKPIHDANRKIIKGRNYQKADLRPFA
jgi:hypothetical protein